MVRLTLLQIWDNMVLLFIVNLAAVAGVILGGSAVHAVHPFGPAVVAAVALAVVCWMVLLLLLVGAFLDHLLADRFPDPFRPLHHAARLAPFALLAGSSLLCALAVVWQSLVTPAGGTFWLARVVVTFWFAALCLQVVIPAGVRIACGEGMTVALSREARHAITRPARAFGDLALALALLATMAIGIPGIGGAFIALRARAGLDVENRGRSADRLNFLSVVFPWKR